MNNVNSVTPGSVIHNSAQHISGEFVSASVDPLAQYGIDIDASDGTGIQLGAVTDLDFEMAVLLEMQNFPLPVYDNT